MIFGDFQRNFSKNYLMVINARINAIFCRNIVNGPNKIYFLISFSPAVLDTVKNVVFLQRGKISRTSLDKMALVSAKIKIRI